MKAASLTPEETRDILSTTQNKLDFEAISQALSALWDEQLLGHRYSQHAGRHGSSSNALWHEWHDDGWDDGYEMNYDERTGVMMMVGGTMVNGMMNGMNMSGPMKPLLLRMRKLLCLLPKSAFKKLFKLNKSLSNLQLRPSALGRKTQKTTQQLKRDRGFGHVNTVNNGRCFKCGGNHLVRDCPGRRHGNYPKGKLSGKGKGMHYMIDPNDAFFQNKGKGKKGKSKFSHMSEQEMFWNSKGKSPLPLGG